MRQVIFILGTLADGDIDWIASAGRKREFADGEVLIRCGTPTDAIYIVLEGELTVSDAESGKVFSRLKSGEVIGEISLLDSRPPTADVTATGAATVLELDRATLDHKLVEDTSFASRFYHALGILLAHRLRKLTRKINFGAIDLSAIQDEPEETDFQLLESAALAGKRFDWILQTLLKR